MTATAAEIVSLDPLLAPASAPGAHATTPRAHLPSRLRQTHVFARRRSLVCHRPSAGGRKTGCGTETMTGGERMRGGGKRTGDMTIEGETGRKTRDGRTSGDGRMTGRESAAVGQGLIRVDRGMYLRWTSARSGWNASSKSDQPPPFAFAWLSGVHLAKSLCAPSGSSPNPYSRVPTSYASARMW